MRITKIDVIPISTPYVEEYHTELDDVMRIPLGKSPHFIVKIYTDEDIIGFGETSTAWGAAWMETPWTIKPIVDEYFSPVLTGKDPFDIEKNVELMDKILSDHNMAKDAIVTALYDVIGKALGVPLYKLIGGLSVEKMPITGTIGFCTPEEAANKAVEYKNANINAAKVKLMDYRGKDVDAKRIESIRDAAGPDFSIRVDANGTYPHIKTLKKLEKYEIDIIEQPAASNDLDGMHRYAEIMDTPVLADEGILGVDKVISYIKNEAADIICPKDYQVGGIYRAKQILGILKAYAIPYYLEGTMRTGIGTAATLHLICSTTMMPGCFYGCLPGPYMLKEDFIKEPIRLENGCLQVPKGVGLGVKVDEEKIKEMTYTFP
jgi:L-alanine-DL-glutamate epimerase-like enolase superfamily enzyme